MKKILILLLIAFAFASCTQTGSNCPTPCKCVCDTIPPPKDTVTAAPFFFGCNSNHWQPKEKQIQFSGIRLYLPIGWVWTANGFYGDPFLQAQKQFLGLDQYLTYMKGKNRDVLLTLMQSPDYLNGHTAGWLTNDWPPVRPGADKNDPRSYSEIASIYKALAIRYGSKQWPEGSYRVDPAPPRWNGDERQVYKSGLDLVKTIEIGNEEDSWWNQDWYMTAEQYAAMLMTCYDSIKVADPKMQVTMCGLTNLDFVYLEKMRIWFSAKGRAFLSDAIQVHRYNNRGNLPGVHPPTWTTDGAVPVEIDPGISDFQKVMDFARLVGKPVFVSEYGYDTRPGTWASPTPVSGKTLEELQAQWVTRAALEYARMGAARVYCFTMADEPNPDGGLYNSSGLLYGEARGYAPKPAFTAATSLIASLAGLTLKKDESSATARILRFEGNDNTTYVYWSPTMTGASFQAVVGEQSVTVTEAPQSFRLGQ